MSDDHRDLRLFTAIELPEEWRAALTGQSEQLQRVAPRAVKWVRPELMHVTLVFLGSQPRARIEEIEAAMDGAAERSSPFQISLGESGAFGPPERLRTLWAGLRDTPGELTRLHAELVRQLAERHIPFDRKALVPHITIGRTRAELDRLTSLRLHAELQRTGQSHVASTEVREIALLESRLRPQGPEYIPLYRARLGGGDGEQ
jgi:RNA 2',3'-cyclic 3'-phosphodiesterase